MSESCIVDINFKSQTSKIKIDNDRDENSITVNLGKYKEVIHEDSVFFIKFESGEVRFSISVEDVNNLIKNINDLVKKIKEK